MGSSNLTRRMTSLPLKSATATVLHSRSRASKDLVGLFDSNSQRTASRQLHHKVKIAVERKVCMIFDPPLSRLSCSCHSQAADLDVLAFVGW